MCVQSISERRSNALWFSLNMGMILSLVIILKINANTVPQLLFSVVGDPLRTLPSASSWLPLPFSSSTFRAPVWGILQAPLASWARHLPQTQPSPSYTSPSFPATTARNGA